MRYELSENTAPKNLEVTETISKKPLIEFITAQMRTCTLMESCLLQRVLNYIYQQGEE